MNRIVGNNLKTLRKAKKKSQEEVADHLNISQSAYARMERGESTSWATHFYKICQVFDISPEELVKKELGIKTIDGVHNTCIKDENEVLSLYRKIIKQNELQSDDLKIIIDYLKNKKGLTLK